MPPRSAIDRAYDGRLQPDPEIARLAGVQHGVVSRRQLLARGLSADQVDRRLRGERLHAVHAGVYAVGHASLAPDGHRMAAVLASGPGAVLSGRSAAALWALRPSAAATLEITTPRALRPLPGIRRRRAALAADEVTVDAGIPVTTVARTLLDLAAALDAERLRRALTEAERRRLHSRTPLVELVRRHPRAPGIATLRALLADRRRDVTRSELELQFLALVGRAGLPRPRVNAVVEGLEVDCSWPAARLVVELDGGAFHRDVEAFETDRRRDRRLAVAGWTVVRITHRQLADAPAAVLADLRTLL
jgi:very-short-patch-repair endonuclease